MRWRDLWPWQRKNATLELFRELTAGRVSRAGTRVAVRDAIRVAAVFACARVIANGLAQVPLKLFHEDADGRKAPAREHPLYHVLHRRPNPWQTSFEMRETLALHLALAGRAYVFKTIVGGRIRELIPFDPLTTECKQDPADPMRLLYVVQGKQGAMTFDQSLIWHLKGPSWSGWEGIDALEVAREAIGLSIATESAQSDLHRNGLRVPGVYSVEGKLDGEQYRQLRQFLKDNHSGDNAGLPMIVDRGAKWLQLSMTGLDAQALETRKHQVVEVCRAMGVMPIMVFEADKAATYASAEAMFQAHVVHTLAAWWERVEQSIDCNLLTENELAAGLYAKFVGAGLLRGSMTDRAEYFAKALGAGGSPAWMTQDEVRGLEELNPMGDDAARLPVATNVPPPADPVQAAKTDGMLLALAEIKGQLHAQAHQEAPAPAGPTINVATPPVNFTSHAQPDMEPIVGMLRKSLEGMTDTLAKSMAAAVKAGLQAVPAPVVNVKAADQAAPVVNVQNDVVVQPAAVDVTLALPPRKTTTDITYDADGNIVKTVATERDA